MISPDPATTHGFSIDWLQAIGAFFGITGSWLVGSQWASVRLQGWMSFLISNACFMTWSASHAAWWIFAMQCAFALTSVRGVLGSMRSRRLKDPNG